jgi:hypothetical protein
MDSDAENGLAGNGNGDVYGVFFDSLGFTPGGLLNDAEQLLDNHHSVVNACPKPIHFRRVTLPNSSGLTCLSRLSDERA